MAFKGSHVGLPVQGDVEPLRRDTKRWLPSWGQGAMSQHLQDAFPGSRRTCQSQQGCWRRQQNGTEIAVLGVEPCVGSKSQKPGRDNERQNEMPQARTLRRHSFSGSCKRRPSGANQICRTAQANNKRSSRWAFSFQPSSKAACGGSSWPIPSCPASMHASILH